MDSPGLEYGPATLISKSNIGVSNAGFPRAALQDTVTKASERGNPEFKATLGFQALNFINKLNRPHGI